MYTARLIFSFLLILWFSNNSLSQTLKPVTAAADQINVYHSKQDMLIKIKSNIERRQDKQPEEEDENETEGNKNIKSDSTQAAINKSRKQKLSNLIKKD